MRFRNLEHHIHWQNTWQEMRNERMRKPQIDPTLALFKKSANLFSRLIQSNNYEFGRKAVEILSGIINAGFEVLEIGAGPGSLTIPLAKKVKKIDSVELSQKAIAQLKINLQEENLNNVEIINQDWSEMKDPVRSHKYDLVVCSHFLWQMPDIEGTLRRLENASHTYCAVIQPCGRDEIVKDVFEEIGKLKYTGQFEPDADYFAYVILREWGRWISVMPYDYTFVRNLEEEIRYVADFVGRYIKIDQGILKKIRKYLLSKSETGTYIENNKAVVMWWEPGTRQSPQ